MVRKSLIALSSVLLFVGCGGTNGTSGDNAAVQPVIESGTYEDSAVQGVGYVCGVKQGTTGANGGFLFEKGKDCTFSINSITLRSVASAGLHEGVKVKETDVKVARFLQSLDIDGNPDNGIVISAGVVEKLKERGYTAVPDNDAQMQSIVNALKSDLQNAFNGTAKTIDEASRHLAGFSVNISNDKASYSENETVTFDADITGSASGLTYTWKEGSRVLGTAAQLSVHDFSLGSHTVTLEVKNAENITLNKTATVTILNYTPMTVSADANMNQGYAKMGEAIALRAIVSDPANVKSYTWVDAFADEHNTTKLDYTIYDAAEMQLIVEKNTTIGTQKDLNISNLAAGRHKISLKVEDNAGHIIDSNKTLSIWVNFQYAAKAVTNDTVIIDHEKGLMWINEDDHTTKHACLAIHREKTDSSREIDDSFDNGKVFCENLVFAGFDDWRTPFTDELAAYMSRAFYGNILTAYDAACPQLLAIKSDSSDYQSLHTRYDKAGTPPVGYTVGSLRKSSYASPSDFDDGLPVGLRCVRTGTTLN